LAHNPDRILVLQLLLYGQDEVGKRLAIWIENEEAREYGERAKRAQKTTTRRRIKKNGRVEEGRDK